MLTINARAAWIGDSLECATLYRQFTGPFRGSFRAIRSYYGWKRRSMVTALRIGRAAVHERA